MVRFASGPSMTGVKAVEKTEYSNRQRAAKELPREQYNPNRIHLVGLAQ